MILSKREKVILHFCIATAVAASLYIFGVKPLTKKWGSTKIELERKEIKLQKNLRAVEEKDRLYKKFEAIRERIKTKTPGTTWASAFLTALESKARSNRIQISSLEPLPAKDYSFYKKLSVRMNIKCDIKSLAKFLYEVQDTPDMVVIEKLQINQGDRYTSLLKVEILMSLIVLDTEGQENHDSAKKTS